jgi:hypothetical protein
MNFSGAFSAFSHIPIDWLIIGVFFIVVFTDAVRAGSIRAAAISLSFPLSALLYQMIPQTVLLSTISGQFSSTIEQALIFAILEVVIFVCVHQMLSSFNAYASIFSATVSALCATVVVLVVWTQVPVLQSVWHFDATIEAVFGASYHFFWITGAYLLLAFVGS